VNKAIERQQMVADRNEDLDVIGVAEDDLEAAVQVFFVRRGRVVGRKGFILDKVEDLTPPSSMAACSSSSTAEPPAVGCPSRCWCRGIPTTSTLYEEWLTEQRGSASPSGCPSGATSASWETVTRNARGASPATGCAGRTTTAAPRRSTSCRSGSACPRPRCASSATT
jgi:excinuclease ABC subunit C